MAPASTTSPSKNLMTSSAVLTKPTTSVESTPANTPKTASQGGKDLIDDTFYIQRQRWGTFISHLADGTPLVTSLTEELCLSATRFWLKGSQGGWDTAETKTYDSFVGGKL